MNHFNQQKNHEEEEEESKNYIGNSLFQSNEQIKLSQTLFAKTESKKIDNNIEEIENLIEKKAEEQSVRSIEK